MQIFIFSHFFLITYPEAQIFSLKLTFAKIFMLKFYFASIIYEKREGSGAGSIPLTYGSGSGRPENMLILRIRIPNTAYRYPEKK
jgi:hypothetical protein